MIMTSHSIKEADHLKQLDEHLKDNLYIGGNMPNAEDALVFEQFQEAQQEPNPETHQNLWAWYSLVILFEPHVLAHWKLAVPKEKKPQQPKKEEKKPKDKPKKKMEKEKEKVAEVKEEKPAATASEEPAADFDPFAEETPDDKKRVEDLQASHKGEKKKEKPPAKSFIILEVKVWEPEQDLDALAGKILEIEKDGLEWKTEYKLVDVAFGVKKIMIGFIAEDDKISVEDIIEELQSWEDDVQSVDVHSFNKL